MTKNFSIYSGGTVRDSHPVILFSTSGHTPEMLNKTTGCESRTVPPLYVLTGKILAKAGHWGNPGRPSTLSVKTHKA